ncbi:MAG: ABC transporter ATP-binding protein [Lachnospiraceae bacterium]|nr:ABC transporter ATP-binding protein [Lachnospiraceae bacterium]
MEIELKNLTKAYGDFKAVDGMNLHIKDGDLVGLLGPSGCGKSTTLFMLAGLSEPTEGQIFFGDKDVTKVAPEEREIGLVFQNYALYPHMTVEDNIMFPLINRKMKKPEAMENAYEMAKLVQLDQLMKRKPKELSGGQQQRVAIARALVKQPEVLLLDEPLSNLDAKLRVETREEIRRIQQEVHITTIFVTHDQEEAMSISDKIAVMDRGVVQQYEVPQKMYLNPVNLFVAQFLGMPQINVFEAQVKNHRVICNGEVLREGVELADGTYKMGIRPESFELDPNGLKVDATHVRMTGRDLLITCMLGGISMRALVHSVNQIGVGDRFGLRVRDGQILVFDTAEKLIGKY